MGNNLTYLDTYLLQQDMRIRLPKCILENMNAVKGQTRFDICYDKINNSLVLKIHESNLKEQ